VNKVARFVLGRMMPRVSVINLMERSTRSLRDERGRS
jgi:hypothetical protein